MHRRPIKQAIVQLGLTSVYLFIVIVSWGTNYPLMKLALRDMPPLTFSAVRLFGGAGVVAILLLAARAPRLLPPPDERARLAGISILQYVSVLGLASVSLQFLPAGRTVTIIYSMPLWAAIFDVLILRARLSWVQYMGILVSIGGMLLFLDPAVIDWDEPRAALGVGMTLTAAMCWGLGAVLYRKWVWTASLLSQTLWQLLAAGCVLAVAAICMEFPASPRFTTTLIFIMLWNWVVPTAVAVWAWTKILSYIPSSIAGQFLMTTPFVGIAFSAWIFNEDLPTVFAASAGLITLGSVLTLIRRPASPPADSSFHLKNNHDLPR